MPRSEIPKPEDFRFSCEVAVRFRDLDSMGHVNNAVYLTYFEIARTLYARALGHCAPDEREATRLFPFILLDVYCRFIDAAKVGDELLVYLRTTGVGNKSFEFEYLVTDTDGSPKAVGRSTQVYYDYAAQKTLPVPERFRELLAAADAG